MNDVRLEEELRRIEAAFGKWIESGLPDCGYGFSVVDGRLRITLRPQELSDEVQMRIDELKRRVVQDGFDVEYDIRETGIISALS